jgi:hypothetical protein
LNNISVGKLTLKSTTGLGKPGYSRILRNNLILAYTQVAPEKAVDPV